MSEAGRILHHDLGRLLCEYLPRYIPNVGEASQALAPQKGAAKGAAKGYSLPPGDLQSALEARRARFTLSQLQQLRAAELAQAGTNSSQGPHCALDFCSLRLSKTPERFLGEVALGLHL